MEIEYHIHFTSLFYHHMLYRSQPISTLQKTLELDICQYTNCQFYFFAAYIHFLIIGIGFDMAYISNIELKSLGTSFSERHYLYHQILFQSSGSYLSMDLGIC